MKLETPASQIWEVLKGFGVDGAGGISPFSSLFCAFLRFFCGTLTFFALFFAFLRFILEQGQITAIYWKNGEFHSDPVCIDPVENFPTDGSHFFTATDADALGRSTGQNQYW